MISLKEAIRNFYLEKNIKVSFRTKRSLKLAGVYILKYSDGLYYRFDICIEKSEIEEMEDYMEGKIIQIMGPKSDVAFNLNSIASKKKFIPPRKILETKKVERGGYTKKAKR